MGGKMMRYIMHRKGIDSLESLRQQALENGVEFIACQMSMDVMGALYQTSCRKCLSPLWAYAIS